MKKIKLSVDPKEQIQLDHKYRPQSVEEVVLPKAFMTAFKGYIKSGNVPHLLFHSSEAGTGKTTTAKAIINDLGLDPRYDYIFKKGDDVNVTFIKSDLYDFCSSASPTGKRKIVIIDEYDRPTLGEAQRQMRAVIDEFSDRVTFIITANDPTNIHDALRSRMHEYDFGAITGDDRDEMKKEFFSRMMAICEAENIEVKDERVLKLIVNNNFPYMRSCLTELSKYAIMNENIIDTGILITVAEREKSIIEIVDELKKSAFNRDKMFAIAKNNVHDYSRFTNRLFIQISNSIEDASQEDLFMIRGEFNKNYGVAGAKDFHLLCELFMIHRKMRWK